MHLVHRPSVSSQVSSFSLRLIVFQQHVDACCTFLYSNHCVPFQTTARLTTPRCLSSSCINMLSIFYKNCPIPYLSSTYELATLCDVLNCNNYVRCHVSHFIKGYTYELLILFKIVCCGKSEYSYKLDICHPTSQ